MGAIVERVPELKPVFPDVVDLIVNCPEPVFSQSPRILYWRISEEKLAETYPEETAAFLIYALKGEKRPFYYDDKKKELYNIISRSISPERVKVLKDQLIE